MIPLRWRIPLSAPPLCRLLANSSSTPSSTIKFVLLARQRSGSTWIMDLLNSHPEVIGFHELFMDDIYGRVPVIGHDDAPTWNSFAARHRDRLTRSRRTGLYFEYLDEIVFAQRPGIRAAGPKVMYDQAVSAFGILAYFKLRQVRIVHLIRRNYLDCILSAEAAKMRSVAHARQGAEVSDLQIELEPHSLIFRLDRRHQDIEAARSFYSRLGTPYLEIYYEDVVESPAALLPVLEFLEVEPSVQSLSSSLTKLNSDRHEKLIANYHEIQQTLAGTRYADLLR